MATDQSNRLTRDNGGQIPIVAVTGLAGNELGSSTATATGSYRQITGLSTVKTLYLSGIPTDATTATIVPSGQAVRYRMDGTAPTATVGMPLAVGGTLKLYGTDMTNVAFIEQAASATLDVTYSK